MSYTYTTIFMITYVISTKTNQKRNIYVGSKPEIIFLCSYFLTFFRWATPLELYNIGSEGQCFILITFSLKNYDFLEKPMLWEFLGMKLQYFESESSIFPHFLSKIFQQS
jgi:hypothetical protein